MKRRDFLSISFPATGAIMISPGFLNFNIYNEIRHQFTGSNNLSDYDLLINGAGLNGYFAAINAAKKGLKVLIVDKHSSPGYEIAYKRKLWLGIEGLEDLNHELINLFFPEQERQEIQRSGGKGPNNSLFDDELLLFAGSIRKGMLRNLLVDKIHVLLMTDICGIISDGENVHGALLACKQGLYSVKCRNFIDATDNLMFSRTLLNQQPKISKAGFVLELLNAKISEKRVINVPEEIGILNNQVVIHLGKNVSNQVFLEFEYNAENLTMDEIEYNSRLIATKIGEQLVKIDASFIDTKIHNYSVESSVFLTDNQPPTLTIKGYYMFPYDYEQLNCKSILEVKSEADRIIENMKIPSDKSDAQKIIIAGAEIPISMIDQSDPNEPSLSIPLKKCNFPFASYISDIEVSQVVIAGGGTAGAMAGIGSQERGADTIVVEYFNDFGGTRTMGGVMGYYHGMKDNRLLKKMDDEASMYTNKTNTNRKIGQKLFLNNRYTSLGGKYKTGAIICGTLLKENKIEGIVICVNGKLRIIKGEVTIDATGDGDVAAFAGAEYSYGNPRTGKTQNYSQWNIAGGGKPPSNINSDYDIIDNTKISELQRGLFLSHYEAHFYDFHPYLTVRESRRIKGIYTLNLIDAVEPTHFEDIISVATSDYDPHYVGNSEYTRCGFLLPHSNIVQVEIPYRSIVPEKIDGLLISGKAISQTHDALQFTRMAADITVLGYLTGQLAAHLAIENIEPRNYNISRLQQEWFDLGYLPPEKALLKAGNLTRDIDEIMRRIENLSNGKGEYLYECCRLPKELVVNLLKSKYENNNNQDGKLLLAKALSWFGDSYGTNMILSELNTMFAEELVKGYSGGYIENYDFIRGRDKNKLEGLFWRINQNIGLLAMSANSDSKDVIRYILENTSSGGGVISWSGNRGDYFNGRIDLRIIPYYNRILNLCFYIERHPDKSFISGIEKLLKDNNISGFITEKYHLTRWRIYGGNLEVSIASALARCGSKTGYKLLLSYIDDIHTNFKEFAVNELKSLTLVDFGFDRNKWDNYLNTLTYPRHPVGLVKEIDL